jgi:hypothetical protein
MATSTAFNYETCEEINFIIHRTHHFTYTMTYDDFKERDECEGKAEREIRKIWREMCLASGDGTFEDDNDSVDEDDDCEETEDFVETTVADAVEEVANDFFDEFGVTMEAFNKMKLWVAEIQ